MFATLRVRNFRLYLAGQSLSLVGTWMQYVAQGWLVLDLSHSGTMLGLMIAAQSLPMLLFGTYGGLIADRVNKRRLLFITQTAIASLAAAFGVLTLSHAITLPIVFVLAIAFGIVNAVDNPARQTFVPEIVGPDELQNAVSLNSVVFNACRVIGPASAGLIIAAAGTGWCFLLNAASFGPALIALILIRTSSLVPAPPVPRQRHQIRQGLRYIRGTVGLFVPLVMMALIGTLAFEFEVSLPLFARFTLHGGADTYGLLTAAMGAGAVIGGLAIATGSVAGLGRLTLAAGAFGMAMLAVALAPPAFLSELPVLACAGAASVAFLAIGSTTLQLTSDPRFRGRVMALWSVTFLGSTPIGGPIIGAVADHIGPRFAIGLGGLACLAAAGVGLEGLRRLPPGERRRARRHEVG